MVAETLSVLVRLTLVLSGAIALVAILRPLSRPVAGSGFTYLIWFLIPLSAIIAFMPKPPTTITIQAPVVAATAASFVSPVASAAASAHTSAVSPLGALALQAQHLWAVLVHSHALPWVVVAWCGGFALFLLRVCWVQQSFVRGLGRLTSDPHLRDVFYAQTLDGGPAVVGMMRSRIVLPFDFRQRYAPEEQVLVIAHEQAHLTHRHPIAGGLAIAFLAAQWFNPLAYLAFKLFRIDQELACDAAVVQAHPRSRADYARAILKTGGKTPTHAVVYGWLDTYSLPLKRRIGMLRSTTPSPLRRGLAVAVLALVAGGSSAVAYSAVPDWRLSPADITPMVRAMDLRPAVTQPKAAPKQVAARADRLAARSAPRKASPDVLQARLVNILAPYARPATVEGRPAIAVNPAEVRAGLSDSEMADLIRTDRALQPSRLAASAADGQTLASASLHMPVAGPDSFVVPTNMSDDEAARSVGLASRQGYGLVPITAPGQPSVLAKCYTPTTPPTARCL